MGGLDLHQLQCHTQAICRDRRAFDEAFAPIRQADLRVAYRFDVELECNWKFIYENLLDTYHVGVLHSSTIGAFYETAENENHYGPSGAFTAEYKTKTQAPDGIPLFGMIPWLAERGEDFAMNGYLPPNMSLFIRCDNVNNYTTWPLGPDKCLVRCYHLIAPEFFDDPSTTARFKSTATISNLCLRRTAACCPRCSGR